MQEKNETTNETTGDSGQVEPIVSLANIKHIWFKKGQNSVLRKNKSGCCCIIDDNDNIISACGAHAERLKKHLEG